MLYATRNSLRQTFDDALSRVHRVGAFSIRPTVQWASAPHHSHPMSDGHWSLSTVTVRASLGVCDTPSPVCSPVGEFSCLRGVQGHVDAEGRVVFRVFVWAYRVDYSWSGRAAKLILLMTTLAEEPSGSERQDGLNQMKETNMRTITRRIVPLAGIIAVTAILSVWVTAGAAPPRASVLPTMHFTVVPTWTHQSLNGATEKEPAGVTYQEEGKLVSGSTQIGTFFVNGTVLNNAGWSMQSIEARFPHRGRVELQGAEPPSGPNTSVIVGGTGVFAHASGASVGKNKNITVTFH